MKDSLLPIVAPCLGVVDSNSEQAWIQVREMLGLSLPPDEPLFPAPVADGSATVRASIRMKQEGGSGRFYLAALLCLESAASPAIALKPPC